MITSDVENDIGLTSFRRQPVPPKLSCTSHILPQVTLEVTFLFAVVVELT